MFLLQTLVFARVTLVVRARLTLLLGLLAFVSSPGCLADFSLRSTA